MSKKALPFWLILLLSAASAAQANEVKLSGQAGAFADIGLGLRPLGLGGAYSALAADENAVRWNPSLLADVHDPIAGFTWTNQFSLIPYHYLSTAIPVRGVLGAGEDLGTGAYFVSAGDQAYRETTVGLGVGFKGPQIHIPVEKLRLGAAVKLLFTSFGNDEEGGEDRVTGSSLGYSLDLGAAFHVTQEVVVAAVLSDLVNDITWDSSQKGSYSEGLPRNLILGAGIEKSSVTLSFEFRPGLYADVKDRMVMGAEAALWKFLKPRLGFARNLSSQNPNQWVTAGLGIDIKPKGWGPIRCINFGYTQMFHKIDSSPRVGLVIGW